MSGVGTAIQGCRTTPDSGHGLEQLNSRIAPVYPFSNQSLANVVKVSIGSNPGAISVISESKLGTKVRTFGDHWYNRIHISPSQVNVGNLLTLQTHDIVVWNAYFEPRTLDSILESADSGITLSQPSTPPVAFSPLQAATYELGVGLSGPPVVSGEYLFSFGAEQLYLRVSGNRVVVWPFVPQHGVTESLEWRTDVIRAKAGEQRVALRDAPRQTFSYKHFMDDRQVSVARALAYGWAHRLFGVPVWTEATYVGPLAEGTDVVPLNTALADYRVGDSIMVWENYEKFEAVGLEAKDAGTLFLKMPLGFSFAAAYVMPMRYARSRGLTLERGPNRLIKGEVDFESSINVDLGASISLPQHAGIDVMTDVMYHLGAHDERIERDIVTIDNGFGMVEVDALYDTTKETFTVSWALNSKSDVWRVRQWLHKLKGKWKPFWLPSRSEDLTLAIDANPASTSIYVESINYPLYYSTRALQIVRKNGVRTYHSVTGGQTDGPVDVLSFSASVGVDTPITSVDYISFMYKVRLDVDRVEIEHEENGYTTIKVPVIEVKN